MTLLVGLGIQGFYFIRYYPFNAFLQTSSSLDFPNDPLFSFWQSAELEIYVLIGVLSNDIFAYFGGIFFGKHKMVERISPKKTWE